MPHPTAIGGMILVAVIQAALSLYLIYQLKHVRDGSKIIRPSKRAEIDLHTSRGRLVAYIAVVMVFSIGPIIMAFAVRSKIASIWDFATYSSIILLFLAGLFPIMHVRWFRPSIENCSEKEKRSEEISKSELRANLAAEVALLFGVLAATSGMLGALLETVEARSRNAELSQGCLNSLVEFVQSFSVNSPAAIRREDIVKSLPTFCQPPPPDAQ